MGVLDGPEPGGAGTALPAARAVRRRPAAVRFVTRRHSSKIDTSRAAVKETPNQPAIESSLSRAFSEMRNETAFFMVGSYRGERYVVKEAA